MLCQYVHLRQSIGELWHTPVLDSSIFSFSFNSKYIHKNIIVKLSEFVQYDSSLKILKMPGNYSQNLVYENLRLILVQPKYMYQLCVKFNTIQNPQPNINYNNECEKHTANCVNENIIFKNNVQIKREKQMTLINYDSKEITILYTILDCYFYSL